MIDLHTHTLFSDGALIPSEHVRRLEVLGYGAVGLTDHADASLLDFIIPRIVTISKQLNDVQAVKVIPGVELTHVPPVLIAPLAKKARDLGAALVVVHGETIVEPVAPGTNRAAIEAGVDLLAHPGLISPDDATLAAKEGVFLEISGRSGHSLTNGHVARSALDAGASLILDSDAHGPGDFMTRELAEKVVEGAGLPKGSLEDLLSNARQLLERIGYPL